jgi:two-component system, chemotaxis family, CheB/CheR fusion protein
VKTKKAGLKLQRLSETKLANEFPIVGIGASAGGLDPIRKLLENLPVDMGMAFVVIQHLAPGQESLLPEILSRSTKMKVQEVQNGMQVEQDNVYVITPGTTMTLKNNQLILVPKGLALKPINDFMISLSSEKKTLAIGIVLSGTGNDGTEGLKAIKAEGGIAFAQEPATAQYPDMPKNAIAAGPPDFVLSPEQIAKELVRIAKFPQLIRPETKETEHEKVETDLKKIILLLKASFGVDFTHYKETTINRRITRRIVINKSENLKEYVEYLRKNPNELQSLFDDLLIGVTSFFREPKTFLALKEKVFPELVQNKCSNELIRVWVPGCSTGEEVYSFAIAIKEFLEEKDLTEIRIQIFGTDANEKNIEKARQGTYPKSIEDEVSQNRLKRFFTSDNGHCRIIKFIREMCIFAKQDITTDPPFSNVDLIICRNVLIYFDSQLHDRVLPIFHYGLTPNGFLVLGESESVGKFQYLFEPITSKGLIYRKKQAQPQATLGETTFTPYAANKTVKSPEKVNLLTVLSEKVDHLITSEYGPASLLVNNNLDILVFRGEVTPFISPESGTASLNLTKIIRKELRSQVQTAVYRAKKEDKTFKETVRFKQKGEPRTVNIEIRPLKTAEYDEPFYLVLFTEATSKHMNLTEETDSAVSSVEMESLKDRQIRELREDLDATKESLQSLVEGQEATNEELRSSMEEVQSSNEELQSTNEELETAKEELQSGNEELQTLNEELKNRNQVLGRLNDDLTNLQTNIDLPVVIVDNELKIRRFTVSAQKLLKISPADIGKSINDFNQGVHAVDLGKTISNVTTKLIAVTQEVECAEDRLCEMHVRPYLTETKKIDGAVVSFTDITEHKKAEQALRDSEKEFRSLFANMMDGFAYCRMIFNDKGKPVDFVYLQINDAFERITGLKKERVIGKKVTEAIPGTEKANPELFEIYGRVALTGKSESFEIFFKPLALWLHVSVYSPKKEYFVAMFEDISNRKKMESELEEYRKHLENLVKDRTEQLKDSERLAAIGATAGMVGHDIRNPLQAIAGDVYLLKEELKDTPEGEEKSSVKESLEGIEKNVEYINKIVADLQDFARPLKPNAEETDLKLIIEELLAKNGLPDSVKVRVKVETEAIKVAADSTFINRILHNLVNNAVQAMPKGGKLTIQVCKVANDIIINVKDTGVGIPKEIQGKMFTPMFTTKPKGQGFGLAVVKRMTESLGGTVTFESEEGKGTTFFVRLPFKKNKT